MIEVAVLTGEAMNATFGKRPIGLAVFYGHAPTWKKNEDTGTERILSELLPGIFNVLACFV